MAEYPTREEAARAALEDEEERKAASLSQPGVAFGGPPRQERPAGRDVDYGKSSLTGYDIGQGALLGTSLMDPTPTSDLASAALYQAEGDPESAAWAAAAAPIPFLAGPVMAFGAKAVKAGHNILTPAAVAGIEKAEHAKDALNRWVEEGFASPYFQRWSGGKVPDELPRPTQATEDIGHIVNPNPKDKAAELYYENLRQEKSLEYLDPYTQGGALWQGHHFSPRIVGSKMDPNMSFDAGFHLGTESAAFQRREGLERKMAKWGGLDPTTEETLEAVFRPKGKLVPVLDGAFQDKDMLWFGFEHATRHGDAAAAEKIKQGILRLQLEEKMALAEDPKLREYLGDSPKELIDELGEKGAKPYIDRLEQRMDFMRETLKDSGYSGAIYINNVEDAGSISTIAFDPLDVKIVRKSRALGPVRGTFGTVDPRFAHGAGGAAGAAAVREELRKKAREGEE